jgi:hypothetical protein
MRTSPQAQRRRGVVLLGVLVVIVLLSLAAYKYTDLMYAEYRASYSATRAVQARAFAESGIAYTMALLANPNLDSMTSGNLWDNVDVFSQPVESGDPHNAGRFFVLSLSTPDDQSRPFRFGVTDECGKININAVLKLDKDGSGTQATSMLMQLPNMTSDIAAAILDWIDEDSDTREGGAESEVYMAMDPPYSPKNGPLDSLEELLLVRGVTPDLLFGGDRNHNGVLESDEGGSGEVAGQGWAAFLTVYSREVNVDLNGNQRININNKDLSALKGQMDQASLNINSEQKQLPDDLKTFILAYRLYGGSAVPDGTMPTGTGNIGDIASQVNNDLMKGGKNNVASLWDLVNAQVSASVGSGKSAKMVKVVSPLMSTDNQQTMLPLLLDMFSTSEKKEMQPRINVLTAPSNVLIALRETAKIQEADFQPILDKRPDLKDPKVGSLLYKTPAWLITDAGLKVSLVKQLDKYITSRSQVYRFQVLGMFNNPGPSARVEAVADINQGRPRVLYWRDLSELGRGFPLDPNNPNSNRN